MSGTGHTIDHSYDALNRPIQKVLTTSRRGEKEPTKTIDLYWLDNRLLEEWEDGKMVRSYVYAVPATDPVQMLRYNSDGTISPYYYLFNGRGLVTGLSDDNGLIAERYGYDIYGTPSVTEIFGQPPGAPTSISPLDNPLFGRSQYWDGNAGLFTSPMAPTSMGWASWSSYVNSAMASGGLTDPSTGQRLGYVNPGWGEVPGSVSPSRLNPGGNPNWDNPAAVSVGAFSLGNPNWDNPGQINFGSFNMATTGWNGVPGNWGGMGISPDSIAGRMGFASNDVLDRNLGGLATVLTGVAIGTATLLAAPAIGTTALALAAVYTCSVVAGAVIGVGAAILTDPVTVGPPGPIPSPTPDPYNVSPVSPISPPDDPHSDSGWGDDGGGRGGDSGSGVIDASRLIATPIGGGDPPTEDINFGANALGMIDYPIQFFYVDPNPEDTTGTSGGGGQGLAPGVTNNGVTDPDPREWVQAVGAW